MVRWLRFFKPAKGCGPLCQRVSDEVASMAHAQAIEQLRAERKTGRCH